MLHLLQMTDCRMEVTYDGEGFDDLLDEDACKHDDHFHYHYPLLVDTTGVIQHPEDDVESFEDLMCGFEALIYRDKVIVEVPFVPSEEWLKLMMGNLAGYLSRHEGVIITDEDGHFNYDYKWRAGCPHPLLDNSDILSLFEDKLVEVTFTVEEAKNFGYDTDEPMDGTRIDFGTSAVYHFPGANALKFISEDPEDLRLGVSNAAADRIVDAVPTEELVNPYEEIDLVSTDELAPWLYVHGEEAVQFWNAVGPHLFSSLFDPKPKLAKTVNDELDIPPFYAFELFLDLCACIQHENYAHQSYNVTDHIEAVSEADSIPAEPSDSDSHPWDGAIGARREMTLLDSVPSPDAFDYPADIFEKGDLIEIHSPTYPALITYRVGEYEALVEYEGEEPSPGEIFFLPYARFLHPVGVRRCNGHDSEMTDDELAAFLTDLVPVPLQRAMIDRVEPIDEAEVDETWVGPIAGY